MSRFLVLARAPEARVAAAFALVGALMTAYFATGEGPTLPMGRTAVLLAVLGSGVAVLALRYYAAGLPLLVALVYLNLSEALVRQHEIPSVLQIVVAGLAFAAWLHRDTERVREVLAQPLTVALFAYVLVLLISTTVATDPARADARVGEIVKATVLFGLASALMHNRARARLGLNALIASAAFLSALVVVQALSGAYDNEFGGLARVKNAQIYADVFQPRIAGPIGDPNFFAQILLIPFPVAVAIGWTARSHRRRFFHLTAAALIGAAILLTYSRGAMLAAGIMGLFLLGFLHISWKRTAAAIALAVAIFVALPDAVSRRLVTIEELLPAADAPIDPDSSIQERRLFMRTAWLMFVDNPGLGVGAANYATRYDEYAAVSGSAARLYEDPSTLHFPHNLLLEVAAENGFVGLAAFLAVVVAAASALLRARVGFERNADREMQFVATGFVVAVAGYLVSSLFLHLAFPRYLWLLFAFAASLERVARQAAAGEEAADA